MLCSPTVRMLEAVALGTIVRAFGISLSVLQAVALLGLGSLSTLIPTTPGFFGTYQFVFGQVFALYDQSDTAGVVVASAVRLFCFGSMTVAGAFILFSRSGIAVLRAMKLKADDDRQ